MQDLVRRDKTDEKPYRFVKHGNNFLSYPDWWPPYYNGQYKCDVLQGPCSCGAWHSLTEWAIDTSK